MSTLHSRFRAVLARLEMVSAGCIYSYAPIGSKGGFGSGEPRSGDADPPHLRFRARWEGCVSDEGRLRVCVEAEEELAALTKRAAPVEVVEESREERDDRIVALVRDKWQPREIALHVRGSEREVREACRRVKAREGAGGSGLDPVFRRSEVARLRGDGMTVRQIAFALRVARSTVEKDLAA